jgi:hypothetical protein
MGAFEVSAGSLKMRAGQPSLRGCDAASAGFEDICARQQLRSAKR